MDWKAMALSLRRVVEEKETELTMLRTRYEELRRKGLSERESIMLNRLKHLTRRLINLQVSGESRQTLDDVLEELKFVT